MTAEIVRFPTLDGCFELVDAQLYESVGMFMTYREAMEFANAHQIRRYEIWRDFELIESTEGTEL